MTRVFADTFYFLALLNPKDAAHGRVAAFTLAFAGEMTTTAWVLSAAVVTGCINAISI